MFKGENIPEFLAKKDEIYNGYAFLLDDPTLYAAEAAASADREKAEKTGEGREAPAASEAAQQADEDAARLESLLDAMMDADADEDVDL